MQEQTVEEVLAINRPIVGREAKKLYRWIQSNNGYFRPSEVIGWIADNTQLTMVEKIYLWIMFDQFYREVRGSQLIELDFKEP